MNKNGMNQPKLMETSEQKEGALDGTVWSALPAGGLGVSRPPLLFQTTDGSS